MKDGTLVTFKTGKVVYKTLKTSKPHDWSDRYMLTPVDPKHRRRYNVSDRQLRIHIPESAKPVRTSVGMVTRPKSWRRLPEYSGCTRHTYVGRDWVYKMPRLAGDTKNAVEAAVYAKRAGVSEADLAARFGDKVARWAKRWDGVPVAECYLMDDGVLLMERVRPVYDLHREERGRELSREDLDRLGYQVPPWSVHVDCDQIGYNRNNELVAYDL